MILKYTIERLRGDSRNRRYPIEMRRKHEFLFTTGMAEADVEYSVLYIGQPANARRDDRNS